jgi:hypothetical protein
MPTTLVQRLLRPCISASPWRRLPILRLSPVSVRRASSQKRAFAIISFVLRPLARNMPRNNAELTGLWARSYSPRTDCGSPQGRGRYSPPILMKCVRDPIIGNPDDEHISTSYVERQNLTMRMQMRRFTRLTNGFSKKRVNHAAAVCLHFAHYDFVRVHRTLRCTPAMAAGVSDRLWSVEELIEQAEAPR